MNKKQAIAITLIIIAIFFSVSSLFIEFASIKVDKSSSETIQNANLSAGTIVLKIEPQGGGNHEKG